ncbi:MAG TPA: hypothetical protein VN397_01845 [Candidatus Methylomirabilis sp.]|nr:hypothetical protein [Candidatus Methylomirabilis sp.]
MIVAEFEKRQEKRSFASVRYVNVRPLDGGGIVVRVNATPGFAPRAFHGLRATLRVEIDPGRDIDVPGTLALLPSEHARGLRVEYRFRPEVPDATVRVAFHGALHWSNVSSVLLDTKSGTIRIRNSFFRLLPAADL